MSQAYQSKPSHRFRSFSYSGLAFILCFILFVFAVQIAYADVTVNTDKVYYGNPKNYTNPAQLDLNKVLHATKEYQRIKKEKIKSDNPLYWILLQKANERVQTAIKKVAQEKKYDLVGELGYITDNKDPIPDITEQVIAALE